MIPTLLPPGVTSRNISVQLYNYLFTAPTVKGGDSAGEHSLASQKSPQEP